MMPWTDPSSTMVRSSLPALHNKWWSLPFSFLSIHLNALPDPGFSFDSVLFYGNEWALLQLDILIFAVVDMLTQNYVLAAIITYIVSWVCELFQFTWLCVKLFFLSAGAWFYSRCSWQAKFSQENPCRWPVPYLSYIRSFLVYTLLVIVLYIHDFFPP